MKLLFGLAGLVVVAGAALLALERRTEPTSVTESEVQERTREEVPPRPAPEEPSRPAPTSSRGAPSDPGEAPISSPARPAPRVRAVETAERTPDLGPVLERSAAALIGGELGWAVNDPRTRRLRDWMVRRSNEEEALTEGRQRVSAAQVERLNANSRRLLDFAVREFGVDAARHVIRREPLAYWAPTGVRAGTLGVDGSVIPIPPTTEWVDEDQ